MRWLTYSLYQPHGCDKMWHKWFLCISGNFLSRLNPKVDTPLFGTTANLIQLCHSPRAKILAFKVNFCLILIPPFACSIQAPMRLVSQGPENFPSNIHMSRAHGSALFYQGYCYDITTQLNRSYSHRVLLNGYLFVFFKFAETVCKYL